MEDFHEDDILDFEFTIDQEDVDEFNEKSADLVKDEKSTDLVEDGNSPDFVEEETVSSFEPTVKVSASKSRPTAYDESVVDPVKSEESSSKSVNVSPSRKTDADSKSTPVKQLGALLRSNPASRLSAPETRSTSIQKLVQTLSSNLSRRLSSRLTPKSAVPVVVELPEIKDPVRIGE